jgi:lipoyl(octanoyl) transferase
LPEPLVVRDIQPATGLHPDRRIDAGKNAASAPVEWVVSQGLVPYPEAVAEMEARTAAIAAGEAAERIWLLEHPPLYTAGTSARDSHLLQPDRFPVFRAGRGGGYTYHGPGQRVAYVMLDLNRRGPDLRLFVRSLEDWIIAALARFGVVGTRRPHQIGVWVRRPEKTSADGSLVAEHKIAAIGIRVRRWVSFHGVSLNIDPVLRHYAGIVPCGIADAGVTSLADLGVGASLSDVDRALREEFVPIFGSAVSASR